MKTRSRLHGLFILTALTFILAIGFASAAFTITPTEVTQNITSGTTSASFAISVNNDGAGGDYALTWTGSSSQGTLNLPSLTTSTNGTNQSTSFSVSSISSSFVGTITGNLTAQSTLSDRVVTFTINVVENTPTEVQQCSAIGNLGELEVNSIDFNNKGNSIYNFGEDDEWFPFEEIELEIEVKNDGDYDVDDVEVSWGLYDTSSNEWVIDFDDEKEFNIKDGDEETLEVTFTIDDDMDVDLDELSDGDNYRLYVTAQGTIDDNDSPNDGQETCASDFETASIIIESDFVVVTDLSVPSELVCGQTYTIRGDAWNIGDNDQDEVSMRVYGNSPLDIDSKFIELDDIDAFDSQSFTFELTIPQLEDGFYALNFQVFDEDDDLFENDFDDDESEFGYPLNIRGCTSSSDISISAALDSEAIAGQELLVKTILANTGTSTSTFSVSASGYESWAQLTGIPGSVSLQPGQSAEDLLKFNVNSGVSGEQTFTIIIYEGANEVATRDVTVIIESDERGFLGITGLAIQENGYVWGLGILNLIVIIAIILVAVRIARRRN